MGASKDDLRSPEHDLKAGPRSSRRVLSARFFRADAEGVPPVWKSCTKRCQHVSSTPATRVEEMHEEMPSNASWDSSVRWPRRWGRAASAGK
eukprot:14623898-Alexandrium_andersonii.AAC.1